MSVTAPPKTSATTTATPALYKQALDMAKAAASAEQAPLQEQIAANNAGARLQQQNAGNAAQALSDILKGIAPDIQNTYRTAGADQAAFGKGFSQAMQDAVTGQQNDANALLNKLGNPGARVDVHPGAASDVLYGIGGYIPAKSFSEQGAAQTAYAQKLPGWALDVGQAQQGKIASENASANAALEQKIADLAGKIPGDAQSNYFKLRSAAQSDARLAEQIAHNQVSEKQAQARINQSAANYRLSAAKFARQQFQQDRQYQLSLQRLGISQKRLQLSIAANAFKAAHGGYTASQIGRFKTKLDALAAAGAVHAIRGKDGSLVMPTFTAVKNSSGKTTSFKNDVTGKTLSGTPPTYANFLKAALSRGIPLQFALERANSIWPATERGDLGALANLPEVAAQSASQARDYGRTVGTILGTSPNGVDIHYQMPSKMSAGAKKTVLGVLQMAQEYLGTPYAWGGESPTGFDCSGLAQYLYAKHGINIPRTTYDQFKGGLEVPKNQLQPGDLVFFMGSDPKGGLPGHVGIYVGAGKMIDAPHTGAVVRVDSINQPGYAGARRYVH